ncbi:MAG: thiol-disulfide oxidoreductase DCC family protein, partial [Planctomycetaceae bacterium]
MSAATEKQPTDRPNPPESVTIEHPIVFFDGVCGLCSRVVDFVMARDPQGVFRFAPLQGQT